MRQAMNVRQTAFLGVSKQSQEREVRRRNPSLVHTLLTNCNCVNECVNGPLWGDSLLCVWYYMNCVNSHAMPSFLSNSRLITRAESTSS